MRLYGWIMVAVSAVAFYLTPKYLAMMAGANEWGKDPQTQFQLAVTSLGRPLRRGTAGRTGRWPTARPPPRRSLAFFKKVS